MADLLNTSISGLLAFQRALDVTSHNITNANTPGYSRQLPDFQTSRIAAYQWEEPYPRQRAEPNSLRSDDPCGLSCT